MLPSECYRTVYRWVRELTEKADGVLRPMKVDTGAVWVADEVAVKVGGKTYWVFNVLDSETRSCYQHIYRQPEPRGRRRRRWRWQGNGRTTRPGKSKPMGWHPTGMLCRGLFQPIQ